MNGSHHPGLVALSVLIAVAASHVALGLGNRVAAARGRAMLAWLAGGALAMGAGIWSMHFVGMLAFRVPGVVIGYDVVLLFASMAIAVAASAAALYVVSRAAPRRVTQAAAALPMGVAIAGMHYTGIAGMHLGARVEWNRALVALSIAIAVAASFVALGLATRFRSEPSRRDRHLRLGASIVMGGAIAGMHYTAMAAARFVPGGASATVMADDVLATRGLAAAVAGGTALILVIAVAASLAARELAHRAALVGEVKRLYATARESAEQYRLLFDGNPHPMCVYDPETLALLAVNETAVRDFGYSRAELLAKTLRDLHPAEHHGALARHVEAAAGADTVTMWKLRRKDGTLVDVQVDARAIVYQGRPARLGLIHDVTDRARAQEHERELVGASAARVAAEEARHTVEELFESITDAFFAFDLEWRATYVNRNAEALLSKPREAVIGTLIWELYPSIRGTPLEAELRQAAAERRGGDVEVPSRLKPGHWFHLHYAPTSTGAVVYIRDVTERKQAEESLLEERRRLAEAQRVARIGSWEWDLETNRIDWSDEHFRLWGFEPRSFVPTREAVKACTHPDDRASVADATQAAIRSPGPFQHEHRIVRADGEVRVMDTRGEVIANEAGQAVRVVGTSQDITERKRQEAALNRATAALDASMDGICVISGDGVFEYLNQAKARMLGYDGPEQLLGRSWRTVYPPDEVLRIEEEVLLLVELTGRWRGELVAMRRDGSTFPAAASMTKLEGSGWVGVDWDITATKQAEDELRRRGEMVKLLQMAATTSNESATLEQALGRVVEQVCRFTHLAIGHAYVRDDRTGELVPTNLWCEEWPERSRPFRESTRDARFAPGQGLPGRALAGGAPVWLEDVTLDPGFSRARAAREASLHTGFAIPVRAGSEVVAVLEFFSEARLRPDGLLLDTLSNVGTQLGRVAERTRAERELRAAREEAERANRAKSEFLSRMSHELRTPLNAILGFGQILEMEVRSEDDRESAEQILRAGRHLLGLIDEVLDLARIEAGAALVSVAPVAVRQTVAECLDLLRHMGQQRGVAIEAGDALASDAVVLADPQRLKQVLLNLLSNAIKYNRPGGVATVSAERAGGAALRIVVADTGAGISPEKLHRLFVPFDRLDAEQSGVEGTGLGLALSRGMMGAMGGTLGVHSEEGRGSRFWAELPLVLPAAGHAPEPEAPHDEPSRTVLVIEDNLANLRLVERVFQRRPAVRLLSAMQGSLGLDLAREHRPDLVLLDMDLPDLSGDEVLAQLRQDPALAHVPVVMVSGDAIPAQVQRLLEMGAQGYITKPFDIQELLREVDVHLGRAS
ncbi:PAS domain S-box protein [Longimicrobium sp.]|jgi:PAS domain S-box-containing protein|uniref:PAS domain S-box protein n=1 Tax=Longimicrobium sp. TaxID=2029185 RepID=UPI002F940E29